MKKLKLYQTIPLIIILVLASYLIIHYVNHYFLEAYKSITFPDSDLIFNCAAEEFINGDTDLPREINVLSKNASINDEGDLELFFTRYQYYKFQKSEWFSDIEEFKDRPYLTHSEDFSHIVLNVTPEVKGYTRVQLRELRKDIERVIEKIHFFDIINKQSNNPNSILLEIIDTENGKILDSFEMKSSYESHQSPKLGPVFTRAPFLGQE